MSIFRKIVIILLFLSLPLLHGSCSQDGDAGLCIDSQPKPAVSNGTSELLLENVGYAIVYVVFVDDKKMATLDKGESFTIHVASGSHLIRWTYWNKKSNGYTTGCQMIGTYKAGRKYHLTCGN